MERSRDQGGHSKSPLKEIRKCSLREAMDVLRLGMQPHPAEIKSYRDQSDVFLILPKKKSPP